MRLELILCREVPFANLIVNAENRCEAITVLVGIQFNVRTLRVITVNDSGKRKLSAISTNKSNVLYISIIVAGSIHTTKASKNSEIVVDAVSSTGRKSIIILTSTHKALVGIGIATHLTCCRIRYIRIGWQHATKIRCQRITKEADICHYTFERTQSVVELTFTTATGEGEVSLERPFALIVCILERRYYRSKSLALESSVGRRLIGIVIEKRIRVVDSTSLPRRLKIDTKMVSLLHESHSGRIVIYTIDADRSLTAHHSVEGDVLVGVSKQTTCISSNC